MKKLLIILFPALTTFGLNAQMPVSFRTAVMTGNLKTVKLMIAQGADINKRDSFFKDTPLHWAALKGHYEIVQLLLKAGANKDAPGFQGETPLHKAIIRNQEDIVKALLAANANVNILDDQNQTPLHEAAHFGRVAIALKLIRKGAKINARDTKDRTPLYLAAKRGYAKVVRKLLEKGAQHDIKSYKGISALTIAKNRKFHDVVDILEKHIETTHPVIKNANNDNKKQETQKKRHGGLLGKFF